MKDIENILAETKKKNVYLRHQLKEVTLYPWILVRIAFKLLELSIRQILRIEWWLQKLQLQDGRQLFLQKANLSMLTTIKMEGLTITPCFWITHILWMAQGKVHSILDFKGPCQAHHQWTMFDPCPHKADLYMQKELNSSPLDSTKLNVWPNLLLECIVHIPKQTQID